MSTAFDPLPGPDAPWCRVVPGFLSPEECRALIADAQVRGFRAAEGDYPPSYRNNERQVLDDPALAARLLERARPLLPAQRPVEGGAPWRLEAVNERLRLCRYRPGQAFGIHQDGVHHRGADCRSALTFMVYLTDGAQFEGGDTVFLDAGPGAPARELARVRPRAGSLIVFDHALWHLGERVTAGVKHVLRSDILYRRVSALPASAGGFDDAHRGYVWTLEPLGDDALASAGRDTAIHVWSSAGRRVRTLHGHERSVLALAALPDGRLASASRDRSLRLWDWRAGIALWDRPDAHDAAILALAALPDGTLASAGADGCVRRWRLDGEALDLIGSAPGWVWALAVLPDGRLAGACEDGAVRVWNVGAGALDARLSGTSPLRTLAAAGDLLAAGDASGQVRTWRRDGAGWRCERTLAAHAGAVRRVRWLADGALATAGEDGAVRVWSSCGGAGRLVARHDNFATDVIARERALLSAGYDGRIRVALA